VSCCDVTMMVLCKDDSRTERREEWWKVVWRKDAEVSGLREFYASYLGGGMGGEVRVRPRSRGDCESEREGVGARASTLTPTDWLLLIL
jgi:hypothetical protein